MREVYLDNGATTKTDPDAARVALEMMLEDYGNPSSLHGKGTSAYKKLELARSQLAAALGCESDEVYFTSGGTESNNMALRGAFAAKRRRGTGISVTAVEHASVLETVSALSEQGASVAQASPKPDGTLDPDAILDTVNSKTVLLSCMLVNNETGSVAPLRELAREARRKNPGILIHCDAVQAFGKLRFSPVKLGADLLSVSGHKLHAPKGVGALYVRKGLNLPAIMSGGGQQNKLRPGTECVPLACAFGYAAQKAASELAENHRKVERLSDYFDKIAAEIPGICINSPKSATPYIRNISAPGYISTHLVGYLSERGVYVSGASACSGREESHVLAAMKVSGARLRGALRVSFCAWNTREDVDAFFDVLRHALENLVNVKA